MSAAEPHETVPRPRSRIVTALLSLVAPGTGHVYVGRAGRGFALIGGLLAIQIGLRVGTLAVPPRFVAVLIYANALALLTIAVYLFGVVDAVRLARRAERGSRWFVTLGAVLAVWLCTAATGGLIRLTLPYSPWRTFSVPSASMTPTLRVGEWFLADTWYYRNHAPARGDLVVYKTPRDPDTVFVKRIIALAGDRVEFREGRAVVNGVAVAEPYIDVGNPSFLYNNMAPATVPAGHLFVVGDNRANSMDSRVPAHGTVPVQNLVGRATEIFWGDDAKRYGLWIGTPP